MVGRWVVPALYLERQSRCANAVSLIRLHLIINPLYTAQNTFQIAQMASSSSQRNSDDEAAIEELIFSCSICQATVSDVYSTTESNKGFHSGSGDENGIVVKLWMAECSHITCAKHLEGGAAPFHPQDVEPKAPCPRCVEVNGDRSTKALYPIKGLNASERHAVIPAEWMKCPPVKLDSSISGMEAVRAKQFQYMALVHYSRRIRNSSKDSFRKLHAMETAFSKERKQRRQLQSDTLDLQARFERLDEVESKLKMWETRKPKIFHYLGVFGEMMSEIHENRTMLRNLGYQVTEKSYAFPGDEVAQAEKASAQQHMTSHQANLSSATTAVAREPEGSSSVRKRKRELVVHEDNDLTQKTRGSSRHLMPPPLPRPTQVPYPHQKHGPVLSQRNAPPQSSQLQAYPHAQHNHLLFRPSPRGQSSRFIQRPTYQWQADDPNEHGQVQDPSTAQFGVKQSFARPSAYPQHMPTTSGFSQGVGSRLDRTNASDAYDGQHVSRYDDAYGAPTEQGFGQGYDKLPRRNSTAYEQTQAMPAEAYGGREQHPDYVNSAARQSPFFKAPLAFARPDTMGPPTRSSFSRAQDNLARGAAPFVRSRSPQESSLSSRLRDARLDHGPSQSPQRYAEQQQHLLALPQTPQRSQPFLQRPDRPPPSAMSYAPSRPQIQTQTYAPRNRVSLPPNHGRAMPLPGNQDGALSRIQGVRGLVSRQGQSTGYGPPPPAFEAPRQLFSAAGSRRSVRR